MSELLMVYQMDNYPPLSMDNCRLATNSLTDYCPTMGKKFRDAFVDRLQQTGTQVAELAREAGVSKDMLNKLKQGKSQSINADDAIKVAAYFDETLNQFVGLSRPELEAEFKDLFGRLTEAEQQFLLRQIKGIVADRGPAR